MSDEMRVPKVGDGMTVVIYTDAVACTVEKVSASGRTIWLREDKATLLNGPDSGEPDALTFTPGGFVGHTSGRQRYAYAPDPDGKVWKATWREKRGRYVIVGQPSRSPGLSVREGRSHHYDYNF